MKHDQFTDRSNDVGGVTENAYGHQKRLRWLISHIRPDDTVVEFGCGTACMLSLPLRKLGYSAYGVDLDVPSIEYGKRIFKDAGVDPTVLQAVDIRDLSLQPDVVIASEVFEHITDPELDHVIEILREKLAPGGRLLVTVPNGYGWFELESFLWFKAKVGRLLQLLRIDWLIEGSKSRLLGRRTGYEHPSTVAHSPHVQRFTLRAIRKRLEQHGFEARNVTGSVLFAGPFSNLFFTGIRPLMRLNGKLGSAVPPMASGFYLAFMRRDESRGAA